jgi:hypothetical protein
MYSYSGQHCCHAVLRWDAQYARMIARLGRCCLPGWLIRAWCGVGALCRSVLLGSVGNCLRLLPTFLCLGFGDGQLHAYATSFCSGV